MSKRWLFLAPFAAALAFAAQPASAAEYVYGSWTSPNNVVLSQGVAPLSRGGQGGDRRRAQVEAAGGRATVSTGHASLAGIRDRIADAGGPVIPAYTRKELRAANVVYDMINVSVSPVVMAGAVAETYHLDCPACKDDFSKNNALFLANYSTTRYNLLCRAPITKASETRGRRVRVVGALGRFLKSLGAVPVGGSPAEAGAGASAGQSRLHLRADQLVAVLQPLGPHQARTRRESCPPATSSAMVINRGAWKALPQAQKTALIKHAPGLIANITIGGYIAEDVQVRNEAKKRGRHHHPRGRLDGSRVSKPTRRRNSTSSPRWRRRTGSSRPPRSPTPISKTSPSGKRSTRRSETIRTSSRRRSGTRCSASSIPTRSSIELRHAGRHPPCRVCSLHGAAWAWSVNGPGWGSAWCGSSRHRGTPADDHDL